MVNPALLVSTTVFLASAAQLSGAYELTPNPTESEAKTAKRTYGIIFRAQYPAVSFALHQFSTPVHEALTQFAYECEPTIDDCLDKNLDYAPGGVLAGVRWNDDPPFQFAAGQGNYPDCPGTGKPFTVSFALRTACWIRHFRDVSAIAEAKPETYASGGGTLLARTHFGDLQFLHSMASARGTPAAQTKHRILVWAEFAWRVQAGTSDYIAAQTPMGQVPVKGLKEFFPATEARTVADLFTVGRPWLRHQLGDLAFGSLLHMIEDSYAGGHARRRPITVAGNCAASEIVAFHTYAGQDKAKHKDKDGLAAARDKAELISVLKSVIKMRDERWAWSSIEPYLSECIFPLAADAAPADTNVSD